MLLTWYADDDGDGYGLEASSRESCTAPDGHTETAGDCDDANPAIHPGAEETDCEDPVDYNCDGSTGYDDSDGDGVAACADCDDSDAALHTATTRMVTVTSDDDGMSYQDGSSGGMEVWIRTETGSFTVITPGTAPNCGGGAGSYNQGPSAYYLWSTTASDCAVSGDTGGYSASSMGGLSSDLVIPYEVRLSIWTGGGVSFGWEEQVFLVR